jgi:hypothetical protein
MIMDEYDALKEKIKTLVLMGELTLFEIAEALRCDEGMVEDVMDEVEAC